MPLDPEQPVVVDPELACILVEIETLEGDLAALTEARDQRLALEDMLNKGGDMLNKGGDMLNKGGS
jgi:hypothetical protein